MAEESSSQEKTEEPTARRLEKAREEGQVARSKELSTTMVLVLGIAQWILAQPAQQSIMVDHQMFDLIP